MTQKEFKNWSNRCDEVAEKDNPAYLFSMSGVELLTKIAKGELDAAAIAKWELANRGLDLDGKWVGFGKMS